MDRYLRDKVLYVHGGDSHNLPFLYVLLNHSQGPELLNTLKRKGLIGKTLSQFIQTQCGGEPLKFLKWAIKETLKVNSPKAPKVQWNGLYR